MACVLGPGPYTPKASKQKKKKAEGRSLIRRNGESGQQPAAERTSGSWVRASEYPRRPETSAACRTCGPRCSVLGSHTPFGAQKKNPTTVRLGGGHGRGVHITPGGQSVTGDSTSGRKSHATPRSSPDAKAAYGCYSGQRAQPLRSIAHSHPTSRSPTATFPPDMREPVSRRLSNRGRRPGIGPRRNQQDV